MASVVLLVGRSGSGKSTSGRNLDPTTSFWINADQKDLPFKGWLGKYNTANKNYLKTSSIGEILGLLKWLPTNAPNFKVVLIDTVNRIMTDKVMRERNIKGFDKWSDLAGGVYDIIQFANNHMPDDMTVVLMAHMAEGFTDTMTQYRKIQTSGKQLDSIALESMATIVLFTHVKHNNGVNEYFFETQSDGISTAKSPEGMFESFLIPNDLNLVVEAVNQYKLG